MNNRNEMCFDIKSFKADTCGLTAMEAGAYVLILFEMHISEDGWLSETELQKVARVGNAHWRSVRQNLARFLIVQDGRVSQKRILRERSQGMPPRSTTKENASPYIESNPLTLRLPSKSELPEPLVSRSQKTRTLAKQIPEDWKLTAADDDYARRKGFTSDKIEDLAESFYAHHRGKGTRWTNWHLAWVTWVKNDLKWNGKRKGDSNGKRSGSVIDAWDRLSRAVEGGEDNESGQGSLLGISGGPVR